MNAVLHAYPAYHVPNAFLNELTFPLFEAHNNKRVLASYLEELAELLSVFCQ